jgi:hypothetical protein
MYGVKYEIRQQIVFRYNGDPTTEETDLDMKITKLVE